MPHAAILSGHYATLASYRDRFSADPLALDAYDYLLSQFQVLIQHYQTESSSWPPYGYFTAVKNALNVIFGIAEVDRYIQQDLSPFLDICLRQKYKDIREKIEERIHVLEDSRFDGEFKYRNFSLFCQRMHATERCRRSLMFMLLQGVHTTRDYVKRVQMDQFKPVRHQGSPTLIFKFRELNIRPPYTARESSSSDVPSDTPGAIAPRSQSFTKP